MCIFNEDEYFKAFIFTLRALLSCDSTTHVIQVVKSLYWYLISILWVTLKNKMDGGFLYYSSRCDDRGNILPYLMRLKKINIIRVNFHSSSISEVEEFMFPLRLRAPSHTSVHTIWYWNKERVLHINTLKFSRRILRIGLI